MTSGLARFVEAQAPIHDQALAELRAGRKHSHWMWFVFPQLRGLGTSPLAQAYGIESLDEARAFLAHPLLGGRLRDCTDAVLAHAGVDPVAIFGTIDAIKFRSSMTLFDAAANGPGRFTKALDIFYGGARDEVTLAMMATQGADSP